MNISKPLKINWASKVGPFVYVEIAHPAGYGLGYRYCYETLTGRSGEELDIAKEDREEIVFAILQYLAAQ